MTSLWIPGHPVAQPRPRRARNGHFYANSQRSAAWRRTVAWAVKAAVARTFDGPVFLWLAFVMPIPASLSRRKRAELVGVPHVGKPDLDNLVKAAVDGITTAGVILDDRLITSLQASKRYGLEPGVQVVIAETSGTAVCEFTGGLTP